jgi:hypothetical protein
VPNWRVGDTIPVGPTRGTLRMLDPRFTDEEQVLVVELE